MLWEQGKDVLYGRSDDIQVVVIDDNVYVGGGIVSSRYILHYRYSIVVYNTQTKLWSEHSRYEVGAYGMTQLNKQLIVVGGLLPNCMYLDMVGVWDEETKSWIYPYPPMSTACNSPSVASFNHWLVVAGGCNRHSGYLPNVEVLNTTTSEWYIQSCIFAYGVFTCVLSGGG